MHPVAPPVSRNTKLCSWGASQGVRIPKDMCEFMDLAVGDEVTMTLEYNGSLYIRKKPTGAFARHRRVTIDDLFAGYEGDYRPQEADWGEPVGREEW